MERLDALRDLVVKHIDESKAKIERVYNTRWKYVIFNIGYLVMRKIKTLSKKAKGISGKLAPKFDDPFRTSGFSPPAVYWLEGVDNRQSNEIHVS